MLNIEHASFHEISCLVSKIDDSWLWHCWVAHVNMHHLNHLVKKDLVIGIPKLKFEKNKLYEACQNGIQIKNSFQSKSIVSTSKPHELLHMNLFGPSGTISLDGNYYGLVIVDHYSRYIRTLFLRTKNDALMIFANFPRLFKMQKVLILFQLEVIMELNFKMISLKIFVKKKEFTTIFSLQEHLKKWCCGEEK